MPAPILYDGGMGAVLVPGRGGRGTVVRRPQG